MRIGALRQGNLEDLAKKSGMSYAVDRYFVSSGSVRLFVSPIEKAKGKLHMALRQINNPGMMDYWIPASSTCEAIDAVAKWKFVGKKKAADDLDYTDYTEERFCLL
ncbi:putative crinkler (CRN) family protein [Phytophthora cinnamomi]|uniref:putative crinkler (CRN) family protein n=1 Tax=Phytophthora cinnamomi TaxID=4785 RepID=UPI00355ABECE|nr:putative crinkler (CRN) family protein [Phytophthora cinnamomi]